MSNLIPEGAGIIVGVGVGAAASAAIEPSVEIPKQEAWNRNKNKLLDAGLMARLVAQGAISLPTGRASANREGYSDDKFDHLVYLAQTVPGFAEALALYRRHPQAFADLWSHALVKAGIDARYLPYLSELKDDRLSPPVVALAIVRGILEDPGFLPVGPPSTEGKVRAFPTSPLVALDEAKAFGFDRERLFVQTAISGRPMGPEAAAAAVFKQILERVDFDRAISEGDVRNEWADAIFENARPIPHPIDYIQANLRGWTDEAGMHAGAHRSGMRDADTDLLYKIHGRPLSWHQTWIGLQRGGTYDGPIDAIDPAFLHALRQSDIRPEWYNLAWHSRFTYPSPFVMRSLTQDGTLTAAQAEQDLLDMGWRPDRAKQAAEHWAGSGGTTTDAHVGKAQTQLWGTLHRSYIAGESTKTAARPVLASLGLTTAAQDQVFVLWDAERGLVRKQLTPAQIKKAYVKGIKNQATGATWTRDDALAALIERGYATSEANEFLDL